jgi:hypothetical protein
MEQKKIHSPAHLEQIEIPETGNSLGVRELWAALGDVGHWVG